MNEFTHAVFSSSAHKRQPKASYKGVVGSSRYMSIDANCVNETKWSKQEQRQVCVLQQTWWSTCIGNSDIPTPSRSTIWANVYLWNFGRRLISGHHRTGAQKTRYERTHKRASFLCVICTDVVQDEFQQTKHHDSPCHEHFFQISTKNSQFICIPHIIKAANRGARCSYIICIVVRGTQTLWTDQFSSPIKALFITNDKMWTEKALFAKRDSFDRRLPRCSAEN